MGELREAIDVVADGGRPDRLYAACAGPLPRRRERVDPRSDDDPGPISATEDSFDDVTVAWIAGRLPDEVYHRALAAASGGG